MNTTKPPNYHQGARDERRAILAHVKRLFDSIPSEHENLMTQENYRGQRYALVMLRTWIERRKDRYRTRKGGL